MANMNPAVQFKNNLSKMMVTQLESAATETEAGVVYVLGAEAFVGNNRWITISLANPTEMKDGRVGVRLALSYMKAQTGRTAITLGANKKGTWYNLQTPVMAIDDIFAEEFLPISMKARVEGWAEPRAIGYGEMISTSEKLQLVPNNPDDIKAELGMTLRLVTNPTTGALAKTPIGIDSFYLEGFKVQGGVNRLVKPSQRLTGKPVSAEIPTKVTSMDEIPY